MYSNRMRTARLLTLCLLGGGLPPGQRRGGGLPAPWHCGKADPLLCTEWMAHACENIIFSQFRLRAVKWSVSIINILVVVISVSFHILQKSQIACRLEHDWCYMGPKWRKYLSSKWQINITYKTKALWKTEKKFQWGKKSLLSSKLSTCLMA